MCVVGNAGTVNTGAIDDLDALADICERERLWFHVDGAFGALAALSPELRPLLAGIERADSRGVRPAQVAATCRSRAAACWSATRRAPPRTSR